MGRVESRRVEFLSHSPKPRIDVIEVSTITRRFNCFNRRKNDPVDNFPSGIYDDTYGKKIKIDRVEERNGSEQVFPQRYSVELK